MIQGFTSIWTLARNPKYGRYGRFVELWVCDRGPFVSTKLATGGTLSSTLIFDFHAVKLWHFKRVRVRTYDAKHSILCG